MSLVCFARITMQLTELMRSVYAEKPYKTQLKAIRKHLLYITHVF